MMVDISRLLEAEIPRLRRYARSLLRDASSVEDLVQDTLLRALEKAHLWQPGTSLRAWTFTILHNQYVNIVRQSVARGTEVMATEVMLTTPANQYPAIEFRDLQKVLASLPVEQREVVLMICVEDMRYEEVAEILDIPIGTVRSRLSRARDAIRSRMAGELTKSKERASAIPVSVCFRVQRERINKMRRAFEPLSVGTPLVQAMPIHVG